MVTPARTSQLSGPVPPAPSHPGLSRRAMIQAGAIGLLGLGVAEVSALRALAASEDSGTGRSSTSPSRARSVIYIFLSGGLAHHETFDMKPDGPSAVRGEFKPIPTRTPGVQICEHLPMLAERSHLWALVRSLTHPWNEHSQGHLTMLTGRTTMPPGFDATRPKPTDWPSIVALGNRALQENLVNSPDRKRDKLPPAVVLPHRLVHRTGRVIPGQFAARMGERWDPWFVSAAADCKGSYGACPDCFHHEKGAFDHTLQPVFQSPNLSLPEGLDQKRLRRRLGFLDVVEAQQRNLERHAESQELDRYRQQAISLLANARVQRAFDVTNADAATLDRYGRNQFGWSLLLARRLVEVGVGLVQVNLGNNETWDTHQAAFPNLKNHLLPPFDRSLSALLDDLDASGLLSETMVVVAGEFGRTPRIFKISGAKLAGRDHWGAVQTVLFAGGGVKGGNVIGSSDSSGGYPETDPQKPENMAATIYETLGIPRTAVWYDATDRPHYFYHADAIRGLV